MAHLTIEQAVQIVAQHHHAGRFAEAEQMCRQILVFQPDQPDALQYLGILAAFAGQHEIALNLFDKAIAARPDFAEAHCNRGNALKFTGRLDEAVASYRRAIELAPSMPDAHTCLGLVLSEKGKIDEAMMALGRAASLAPHSFESQLNLGNILKDAGRLDEAIRAFRKAMAINPNHAMANSNLIYTMVFHPGYDVRVLAEEHRKWNDRHAEPLKPRSRHYANELDPNRRLRVGYVAPYFREHVVGLNLIPLFEEHDGGNFEIVCYSNVHRADALTERFKRKASIWRNIVGISDEAIAAQVVEDRIDILVDVSLHMFHGLTVFARKPAPVQATFAGYPGSTGLSAIDYRLSDPYLDPPGMDESIYSEKTVRLPHSFWCYQPAEDIVVNPLPALATGHVTFGCLNNFCKVNDGVIAVWTKVLQHVENSHLLLLAPEGSHRQHIREELAKGGIDQARVNFSGYVSRRDYLALYHRIDLGLDTFPYNGHTTSLDSVWMGVPVVTLVGQTVVGRAGWSQLCNLGLQELAGQNSEQFVQIAVDLARNLPKLAELRATLRPRMQASPIMDSASFARGIEAAYRDMWRTWCETGSSSS